VSDLQALLGLPADRPPRVLAIGAHPDDIEIGAGGTLLRLVEAAPRLELDWVVLSGEGDRAREAEASARVLAGDRAQLRTHLVGGRDAYLPYADAVRVKEAVMAVVEAAPPDLVLVHRRDDAHQDHAFANAVAWQACRRATILEYEIPKWDGDLGTANLYVTLDTATADRKVDHLLAAFPSQAGRSWFTADTFRAVLRLRGVESGGPSGLAEAFVVRKLVA
jgi:LmbE family N-acetylglucosaminyl deacetylase